MESPKRFVFLSILFVIIATIIAHNAGWLRIGENFFHAVMDIPAGQLYRFGAAARNSGGGSSRATGVNLLASSTLAIRLQLLADENDALRRQLHFFTSTTYHHVGAEVIGKDFDVVGSAILVARGSRDGIAVGNPVIIGDGILAGKVLRVEETRAVVRLLNDGQSKIAATLLNHARSIGLVEGGYGISVRMNLIPQNEVVQVGDAVLTSGLERGMPSGLIIGTIEAVVKEAYQPFQYAILTPAAIFDKLTIVSIIVDADI